MAARRKAVQYVLIQNNKHQCVYMKPRRRNPTSQERATAVLVHEAINYKFLLID
jgi:hypothetical protein